MPGGAKTRQPIWRCPRKTPVQRLPKQARRLPTTKPAASTCPRHKCVSRAAERNSADEVRVGAHPGASPVSIQADLARGARSGLPTSDVWEQTPSPRTALRPGNLFRISAVSTTEFQDFFVWNSGAHNPAAHSEPTSATSSTPSAAENCRGVADSEAECPLACPAPSAVPNFLPIFHTNLAS